jgi:hypothetical protein
MQTSLPKPDAAEAPALALLRGARVVYELEEAETQIGRSNQNDIVCARAAAGLVIEIAREGRCEGLHDRVPDVTWPGVRDGWRVLETALRESATDSIVLLPRGGLGRYRPGVQASLCRACVAQRRARRC